MLLFGVFTLQQNQILNLNTHSALYLAVSKLGFHSVFLKKNQHYQYHWFIQSDFLPLLAIKNRTIHRQNRAVTDLRHFDSTNLAHFT